MLLRLARKRVPICEISNWGFTMGRENNLIAAACRMLPGTGFSTVAGQCSAAPISLLCPVSELERQSNQRNFIFIGIFSSN